MLKISILMPCYNSEEFLQRSINSVLQQEYENWELICVDDCSKDDTYKKLQEYVSKDTRIKAIKREINGGCASSLNVSLEQCSGDFIFVLGHDDEISRDCLQGCVDRYYEVGEELDAIIPDCYFVYPDNTSGKSIIGISNDLKSKNRILSGIEAFEFSIFWNIAGFALFRADIVKQHKFLEDCMNGDEYAVRIFFLNSKKVAFSKKGKYLYHQVPTSVTKKMSPKKFDIFLVFLKLEEVAKRNQLKKSLIKKINRERYQQIHNLWQEYLENKNIFTYEEQKSIEAKFDKYEELLKPYKAFWIDSILRRERGRGYKAWILFDVFKIYYN